MMYNSKTVRLCCCCNKGRGKVEDDPADDASKSLIDGNEKETADDDDSLTMDSLVASPPARSNHRNTIGDIEVNPHDMTISHIEETYPELKFSRVGSVGETPINTEDFGDSVASFLKPSDEEEK
jgi:hypothetical protein